MPSTDFYFPDGEQVPATALLTHRTVREIAEQCPSAYLSHMVDNDGTFTPLRMPVFTETAGIVADRAATADSERATWRNSDSIPNCRFTLTVGDDSFECQIYTVQSGTHRDKRLLKVKQPNGRYKAVAFLNTDRTITAWSEFAHEHALMQGLAAAVAPLNFIRMQRRHGGGSFDSIVHMHGQITSYECLLCSRPVSTSALTYHFCSEHMAPATLLADGTTYIEESAEEARQRRVEQRRIEQERIRREAEETARQRAIEERQAAQERLQRFRPLVSQVDGRSIR